MKKRRRDCYAQLAQIERKSAITFTSRLPTNSHRVLQHDKLMLIAIVFVFSVM